MILLLIDFNGRAKNSDSPQVCWLIGLSHYFKWTFQMSMAWVLKSIAFFFSNLKGVDTNLLFKFISFELDPIFIQIIWIKCISNLIVRPLSLELDSGNLNSTDCIEYHVFCHLSLHFFVNIPKRGRILIFDAVKQCPSFKKKSQNIPATIKYLIMNILEENQWNRHRYNQWDTIFSTMQIYTIVKYELWFYWMRQKIPHQTETRRKIYTIRWINIDSSMSLHISGVSITMRVSCWKSGVAKKKYANLAGHLSDELFDGNKRSVRFIYIFFLQKHCKFSSNWWASRWIAWNGVFFHPHFF